MRSTWLLCLQERWDMSSEFTSVEHGAATIVSGIGSYYGVALGVSLETRASIRKTEGGGTSITIEGKERIDTALVSGCLRYARRMNMLDGAVDVHIASQIPPSRGMKSSSSVALAVLGAASKSSGRTVSETRLLRMSAEASIEAGVSVTGAFDDAAACHYGGIVFANNGNMRLLRRVKVRQGYSVVYCVPERRISKRSLPMDAIRERAAEMKEMYRSAAAGRLKEACTANTDVLCSLLDIDKSPALDARMSGALLSGLTGTGPAFFAVCDQRHLDAVSSVFSRHGEVIHSHPTGVSTDGLAF